MKKSSNNRDEKSEPKRASDATRRIVVQDLPRGQLPRAQGRRLVAPGDGPSTFGGSLGGHDGAKGRELAFAHQAPFDRGSSRTLVTSHQGSARAGHKNRAQVAGAGSEQINVRRLLLIAGGML